MDALANLNKGNSPTLALVRPTAQEKEMQFKLNGAEWRGALSLEAYLRREALLSNQALTKDDGISYWILVDTSLPNNPLDPASGTRLALASCESYRKKALVWQDGKLQEVITHGVGSVFCANHLRKRGYAQRMIQELGIKLKTYQTTDEEDCLFSILFSDIGKVSLCERPGLPFRMLMKIAILQSIRMGTIPFITRFPACNTLRRREELAHCPTAV